MNDTAFARDALEALVPPFQAESGDWDDGLRRAEAAYGRRPYRSMLVAAAALCLLVGSAVAGERVIGLFSREGAAVDLSQLSHRDRQILRRLGGGASVRSIEELGNDGRRAYYKIEFDNGVACLVSGAPEGEHRLGGGSCGPGLLAETRDNPLFPTPKRPVTADIYVEASAEDTVPRIWRSPASRATASRA